MRIIERKLKPLSGDLVVGEKGDYVIEERKYGKGVIFIDRDNRPHVIYGNIPYPIKIREMHSGMVRNSFWSVKLPIEQTEKNMVFTVEPENRFTQDSMIDRETRMVQYYHDIPEDSPKASKEDTQKFYGIFNNTIKPKSLGGDIDFQDTDHAEKDRRRYDLRNHNHLIYTIDNESTRDIDDAIEIIDLGGSSYMVGIHVADVSEFLDQCETVDRMAREQGTSIYLEACVIHMLPKILSEDLCSLKEDEDRLALSLYARIAISESGCIVDNVRIAKSVIRSSARLTYNVVDEILSPYANSLKHIDKTIMDSVKNANDLAGLIMDHSPYKDIPEDSNESNFFEDQEGKIDLHSDRSSGSHQLIEMFMIKANNLVGERIANIIVTTTSSPSGIGVYRIQHAPSEKELQKYIRKLEKEKSISHQPSYQSRRDNAWQEVKSLNPEFETRFSKKEKESHIRRYIYRELLNGLNSKDLSVGSKVHLDEATFSDQLSNTYHFSLGINRYAWFTSPIRRYSDVINHRVLKSNLVEKPPVQNAINVTTLSKIMKNAKYAENNLKGRRRLYRLYQRHGLTKYHALRIQISQFRWNNSQSFQIQGQWRDDFSLKFVFKGPLFARISDTRLECEINKRLVLRVGDIIEIQLENKDRSICPETGCIYINVNQIKI